MSTRDPRRAPSSAVGYDYSQGFGPDTGGFRSGGCGHPGAYQRPPQRFGSQPGVPVGFAEAVRRFYAQYAQFSGRASRSEYWWVMLYQLGVGLALSPSPPPSRPPPAASRPCSVSSSPWWRSPSGS